MEDYCWATLRPLWPPVFLPNMRCGGRSDKVSFTNLSDLFVWEGRREGGRDGGREGGEGERNENNVLTSAYIYTVCY